MQKAKVTSFLVAISQLLGALGVVGCSHGAPSGPAPKCEGWDAWSCRLVGQEAYLPRVSLAALLATPERFDGVTVDTAGLVSVEFEGHYLYFDSGSYSARVVENGIALVFPKPPAKELEGKYVEVYGLFRAGRCGFIGGGVGCLEVETIEKILRSGESSKIGVESSPH